MPTKLEDNALSTYHALMTEARIRLSWIEYAASGHTGMDAPLVREFGFLQLRLICEAIALGCLVAHGDIEATKASKFQTSFSASEILQGLEKLHPDFFPVALLPPTQSEAGYQFEERSADVITKAELLELYNRHCGNNLHKGSLKNLLKPKPPVQKHFPELIQPAQRIANLLSIHRMALFGGNTQFMCWLQHEETGSVRVAIAEAVDRKFDAHSAAVG